MSQAESSSEQSVSEFRRKGMKIFKSKTTGNRTCQKYVTPAEPAQHGQSMQTVQNASVPR